MSLRKRIWSRNSSASRRLFKLLKHASRINFPVLPGVHHLLLAIRKFNAGFMRVMLSKVYYEPLLRLSCRSVGPGLLLYENMPKIFGSLDIVLGERVTLAGEQVWIAAGHGVKNELHIANDSYLGHATQIIAGANIRIGRHVLIANRVILNGYDGHPLDPLARARGEAPGPDGAGPITIGDYAWLGNDCTILKNVTIGRGAVVAAGSIVTSDVPELTVVGGIPARPIRTIDPPVGWLE